MTQALICPLKRGNSSFAWSYSRARCWRECSLTSWRCTAELRLREAYSKSAGKTGHSIIKSEDASGASPCQHFPRGSNPFRLDQGDTLLSATGELMHHLRKGEL